MLPLDRPIKPTGGLVILKGSLAPDGCVVKVAGHERTQHRGPARVFEREEDAMAAVLGGADQARRRRRHPLRGPARRSRHARDARRHRGDRRRGARRERRAAHRRPLQRRDARAHGGPRRARGVPRRADRARRGRRSDHASTSTRAGSTSRCRTPSLAERRARWRPPAPRYTGGVLGKYAALVTSAAEGAITRPTEVGAVAPRPGRLRFLRRGRGQEPGEQAFEVAARACGSRPLRSSHPTARSSAAGTSTPATMARTTPSSARRDQAPVPHARPRERSAPARRTRGARRHTVSVPIGRPVARSRAGQ